MKEKRGFLKVYLYLALIFGVIHFVDSILTWTNVPNAINWIISILTIFFFIFNFVTISFFHHHNVLNIHHYLPKIYIFNYALMFILSLTFIFTEITPIITGIILFILNLTIALFLIIFSTYLIKIVE